MLGFLMEAGSLRHKVSIEQLTETDAANGTFTKAWAEVATRRASIRPLSGRELMEARQVVADVTHEVRLRYYSGLVSKTFRFIFGSRELNILSVRTMMERNHEMAVLCVEKEDT